MLFGGTITSSNVKKPAKQMQDINKFYNRVLSLKLVSYYFKINHREFGGIYTQEPLFNIAAVIIAPNMIKQNEINIILVYKNAL